MAIQITDEAYTSELRGRINALLNRRGIKYGRGPAMAYFEMIRECGEPHRIVYVSLSMGVQRERGSPMAWCVNPETLLTATLENFEHWLDDGKGTLVWREEPLVENEGFKWHSYMQCARLGSDDCSVKIVWPIC